jgi:hypothetical protein
MITLIQNLIKTGAVDIKLNCFCTCCPERKGYVKRTFTRKEREFMKSSVSSVFLIVGLECIKFTDRSALVEFVFSEEFKQYMNILNKSHVSYRDLTLRT